MRTVILKCWFIGFLFIPLFLFSQRTDKYNSIYEAYFKAEELYSHLQYGAAKKEYRDFINSCDNPNDPLYQKALYYEGVSALELYNFDAIPLLMEYNRLYPENIHRKMISFKIGRFFFHDQSYDDAQLWFEKITAADLDSSYKEEYHFKMGYCALQNGIKELAIKVFRENINGKSQYAAPSKYFFAHLCYERGSYQLALEQFLDLEKNTNYCGIVPYYVVQIYHKQENADAVIAYAPKVLACKLINHEADVNHIIGHAHYKKGNYQEATDYLIKYARKSKISRDDAYELGYSYFSLKDYENAINYLDKVARFDDSLGQIAMYQIAESYLFSEKLLPARSAFESASEMTAIEKIKEDALYNFAVISFDIDINPYDESVRAFENYLERYPNSTRKKDVYQYLINVYSSTSNYKKAIESLNKLPNLDTRLKRVYQTISYNHGVELFLKKRYNSCINAFSEVSKHQIDPQLVALSKYWMADAYYRLKKFRESISFYKDFISSPASNSIPEKIDAYYNMAYAYKEREEFIRASENFRIYIQSNPDDLTKIVDASFRVADQFYIEKENSLALEFYEKALSYDTELNDKALYYMAKTCGYSGKTEDKIAHLNTILLDYPLSKYTMNADYELAKTYSSIGENDQALKYYERLIADYPNSSFVIDAQIGIANSYFKKWEYVKSETAYLKILSEHESESDICEIAAKGLLDIYTAQNKPGKAADVVERYSCIDYSDDEKENLFYGPAIQAYLDTNYNEAVFKFNVYVENFSLNGKHIGDGYYYLADSYLQLSDTINAIKNFENALNANSGSFKESSAAITSNYYYGIKNYSRALMYYQKLEQLASTPTSINVSRLGIMRSSFFMESYQMSREYAVLVMENPSLSETLKSEAQYALGLSCYYLKLFNEAFAPLNWLVDNNTTFMGSEAQFTLAQMHFEQGDLETSNLEIQELLKMKPSYDFWIAKGLILKSKILVEEADLVQAEQNLNAVIEHYPITDDGILQEAEELMVTIERLKNTTPESTEGENETKIEIDED